MKRLTVIFLTLMILLPLGAKYSPSFSISGGMESLGMKYHSVRTRVDISALSYTMGFVTLSLPVTVSYVAESNSVKGLVSPVHYKNGVGLDVAFTNATFGLACAIYYGYEHFTAGNAMMRYLEIEASPLVRVEEQIALLLPLSYTYTPEGNEYSLSLRIRIGGGISGARGRRAGV